MTAASSRVACCLQRQDRPGRARNGVTSSCQTGTSPLSNTSDIPMQNRVARDEGEGCVPKTHARDVVTERGEGELNQLYPTHHTSQEKRTRACLGKETDIFKQEPSFSSFLVNPSLLDSRSARYTDSHAQ